MLLVCAYAHDYGMSYTYDKVYKVLGSDDFKKFIEERDSKPSELEKEDVTAVKNLMEYLNGSKKDLKLQELYYSIVLAVQLYLRAPHWKGISTIKDDFQGLFEGHLKGRFICGSEGIVEICMCHGKSFKDIFRLKACADGISGTIGDDFHPRFVAAMLRLGDLLDLDNSRFPMWFAREVARDTTLIPELSVLHYYKHESISHLLITEDKIEIRADCNQEDCNKEDKEHKIANQVANQVSEWGEWIESECRELTLHWNKIAPSDFGQPVSDVKVEIYINGRKFDSYNRQMKMQMSQERVMKLLEGNSIYQDRYVGIKETIDKDIVRFYTKAIIALQEMKVVWYVG